MAFGKEARNRLQKFVRSARRILEEDFRGQLQGVFGMNPDTGVVQGTGTLAHLNTTDFETACDLREILAHYRAVDEASGAGSSLPPLKRMLREQTQTVLMRLCAIRMAEERGVLRPSLSAGMNSAGFRNYRMVVGSSLGEPYAAYVKYLKSVCDELALDLPKIFDRTLPLGLLFPGEQAFHALLAEINAPDLAAGGDDASYWAEDETIGWIFQYFNSEEEFAAMHGKDNVDPKNSYELAVRNQFFTPRYVVEFLVDNTPGRRSADETRVNSRLLKDCRSLIWRGEKGERPETLRDPRSLRVLDPACGSMHFGLYAFDLLEVIYGECWDFLEENPGAELTEVPENQKPLREGFSSKTDFLKAVPRLILEFNLFGVDIDVRAAQTASLALWLRAQKSLERLNVPAAMRGRMGEGHVIAAVAPPPEKGLARKIAEGLDHQAQAGFAVLSEGLLLKIPETGFLLPLEKSLKSIEEAVGKEKQTKELRQNSLYV